MSLLSWKNHGDETVAIADIAPGSVSLTIAQTKRNAPLTVKAFERITLPLDERTEAALAAGTISALAALANRVVSNFVKGHKPAAIKHVYAIIRAPWMHSESVHAKKVFEHETRIDALSIRALTKGMNEQYSPGSKDRPCDAGVVKISLNGYQTDAPEGKQAHQLEIDAIFSSCSAKLRQGVTNALHSSFPSGFAMRSGERAIISALKAAYPGESDLFIVEIGIEGTNLLVVRDGIGVDRTSVSEGFRATLKRIARGGIPDDTLATIRMMARDECATPACEELTQAMAQAEPELARIFGASIAKLAAHERLPEKLVLIASPDLLSWLTSFFGRIDFAPFTVTTLPFSVVHLSAHDLASVFACEPGIEIDAEAAIGCALVNSETRNA